MGRGIAVIRRFRALLRHDSQSFSPLGLETNEAALWRTETVEGTK
jgi:hypothetical protein